MRKITLLLLITLAGFAASAQSLSFGQVDSKDLIRVNATNVTVQLVKDTLEISFDTSKVKAIKIAGKVYSVAHLKDTAFVGVPVLIIDSTIEVKAENMIYLVGNKKRLHQCNGWLLYKGKVATTDGKAFNWYTKPELIGGLDEKRKPVTPLHFPSK